MRYIADFKMHLESNSIYNGTNVSAFLGPNVGEHVPEVMRWKECLNAFKDAIKSSHR